MFIFNVNDLTVRYRTSQTRIVDGVSFGIAAGEILGVSGPSGCGKSTMALALMGLLPSDASVSGSIHLQGRNLLECTERDWLEIRGTRIGLVFQESALALTPLMTVGDQVAAVVRAHERCGRAVARQRAIEALVEVGLDASRDARIYESYPHELSGGQRQRVLIAQALVGRPAIVIADEPTASLDADVRDEVLGLIRRLSSRHGTAFVLISHSADVLATTAHRVIEMRAGQIVHNRNGVGSRSRRYVRNDSRPHYGSDPILEVVDARKAHSQRRLLGARHRVDALCGIDLRIERGQTLGLTGPSGCGKSTLARCIAGLDMLDSGQVRFDRRPLRELSGSARQQHRNQVQLVFQDSAAALNPRFTVHDVITEPMVVQGIGTPGDRRVRAIELIQRVGLPVDRLKAHPGELSGGERQRVAIARALAVHPRVLILDEAFSGLDADTRSRIIDVLRDIQAAEGVAYLCISHDSDLLAEFTSAILTMRDGRIVESARAHDIIPIAVPA